MRISDWSSDVCSSDLLVMEFTDAYNSLWGALSSLTVAGKYGAAGGILASDSSAALAKTSSCAASWRSAMICSLRSEERRVGQERVRTCRSRGSAYHLKNKQQNKQWKLQKNKNQ